MTARQTSECRKAVDLVIATGCTPAHAAGKPVILRALALSAAAPPL